jgi:hypothetical protein
LATAIELFFAGRDLVSIYSLATNAWEIIDVLCIKAGIESMSIQARGFIPAGKDLKRNYVNSPYRNFFKHAENDPDQTVEPLSPSHVEGLVFLAVEDYIRLNSRSPVQFQIFQLWYLAKHPEKLDPTVASELIEVVTKAFPGLASLPSDDQVAQGAQMLVEASLDQALLSDPRTELAFE